MSPTLHTVQRISCRMSSRSLLQTIVITGRRAISTTPASKHEHKFRTATYPTFASTSTSCAAFWKVSLLRGAVPKQQCYCCLYLRCSHSITYGGLQGQIPATCGHSFARAATKTGSGGPVNYNSTAPAVGCIRAFGGQSVVPWELALFLVEEMKGEMVQPGAVVYTAALAECRWAGEQRHVDYILDEMKAEGLSIVPGIPGATDNDLPPSQAPPLFGKLPEAPPSTSTRRHQSASDATAASDATLATMQIAARTAETALATVETMWAREEHEPSPATCRAALDACAVGGQWERALSLVRDAAMTMAADADADADANAGGGGIEGEDSSVSGRVEALALEGRWNEALLLVQGGASLSEGGGGGGEDGGDGGR